MLVEQFKCQIPFLNFGNHLRRYFQLGLQECDQKVIKKALDFFLYRNENSLCTHIPVCKKTKLKISIQVMKLDSDVSTFVVHYREIDRLLRKDWNLALLFAIKKMIFGLSLYFWKVVICGISALQYWKVVTCEKTASI